MLNENDLSLSREIEKALMATFIDLSKNGEHFYYCTLITSGDGGSPGFSAWSKEALNTINIEDREIVKWSYADSPYFCYKYDEYWKTVEDIWYKRQDVDLLSDDDFFKEINIRLEIIVLALKNLDEKGIFELNQRRDDIVINVEIMPPDGTNISRALRLNNKKILEEYIFEGGCGLEVVEREGF
jgi:hypothetical protein